MSDQLMRYYERELSFIRQALNDFSRQYPAQSAQLKINQAAAEDPNITRLLDGMALLTANTAQRLDQQLPDIEQDLLATLYPGFLQTKPGYAAVCFTADMEKLSESIFLPKGSQLSLPLPDGDLAPFTTCADFTIQPILLTEVSAHAAPFTVPMPAHIANAEALVQLQICCADTGANFSDLDIDQLDIYVRGFEQNASRLIDLLLRESLGFSITNPADEFNIALPKTALSSRIDDPDFQWLPKANNQFTGYDLLQDYFAYADKQAYFKLHSLRPALAQCQQSTLYLNMFLRHLPTEFLRLFNRDVFSLHTVPALNLFESRGEPLRYDFSKLSIPVIADASQYASAETIAVQNVSEVRHDGEVPLARMHSARYRHDSTHARWSSRHRWTHTGDFHTELTVSFPAEAMSDAVVLSLDLLCGNGRAPCLVPPGTVLSCEEAVDLPGELSLLSPPSAPQYPELNNSLHWRCVSLLNANFASLLETDEPEKALQQLLHMFCPGPVCREADAIKRVVYRQQVAPVQVNGHNIYAVGTEVNVTLEPQLLGNQLAVFSQLLNGLYQQFCSFDRYIQLTVNVFGHDQQRIEFAKVHGSQLCL